MILVCISIDIAEEIKCHCSVCEVESTCAVDRTRGVCTAYYHDNFLVQGCGSIVTLLSCQANNGVLEISDIAGVCCSAELCNSRQALDDMLLRQSNSSSSNTTSTPTISTTASTTQTITRTPSLSSNTVTLHNSLYSICIVIFAVLNTILMLL